MYWKALKPFITELIIFFVIICHFVLTFFITKIITLKITGFSINLIIFLSIWLFWYVSSFIRIDILAVLDFIMHSYIRTEVKFVEQLPFRSSSLLDKNSKREKGKPIKNIERLFYKIHIRKDGKSYVCTSSKYFTLEKDKTYTFVVGKRSQIVIDVCEVNAINK